MYSVVGRSSEKDRRVDTKKFRRLIGFAPSNFCEERVPTTPASFPATQHFERHREISFML